MNLALPLGAPPGRYIWMSRSAAAQAPNQLPSPKLNGEVEHSHRSDQSEFYQLLSYKGDVDLEVKVEEWERFYRLVRPHGEFDGKLHMKHFANIHN
jgi:hypothetical protein